ncbi:hypothetical protein [uncultured Draconibacterium sp.]|uniref:hypothetical protein n=1 Tax=uncultured Draconibacterium sp. TaxID=1573823 RepID=UPI0029C6D359|nr:hypothetical protein [uncultured Draconibacterium sp.]
MTNSEQINIFSKQFYSKQFYPFNPIVANNTSVEEAILLGMLIGYERYVRTSHYKSYVNAGRFFQMESAYIEKQTSLKYGRFNKRLEHLSSLGIISIRKTFGNIRMIKINWEVLLHKMESWEKLEEIDDDYEQETESTRNPKELQVKIDKSVEDDRIDFIEEIELFDKHSRPHLYR